MANSISSYTDAQIMKALLTHNFIEIGSRFEDDEITSIKPGGFYAATNLNEVILPAVTLIHSQAFMDTNLQTLSLAWSLITSIGAQAFYRGWHGLPSTLTLSSLTELGLGAFAGTSSAPNTKLASISLPLWTGTKPNINGFAEGSAGFFEYCSALTSLNLPELTNVPYNTFRYCTSLTELALPKVSTVGSGVFTGCTALAKLDIGGDIRSMSSAFLPTGSSSHFEALILRGATTVPTLGSSFFSSTKVASGTAYIYVPSSLLASFKVASNWSNYEAQLRAIESYPDICG